MKLLAISPLLVLSIICLVAGIIMYFFLKSDAKGAGNKGWQKVGGLILFVLTLVFLLLDFILKWIIRDHQTFLITEAIIGFITIVFLATRK